jgi:hypothetical protein
MDYQTKTSLILPFNNTLMVSNGGKTIDTNNHMKFKDTDGPKNQIYAYDFRSENTGNEIVLTDYPVFGMEIISPADGIVIQVINGAIDIQPGERDRAVGVGNAIIIDHLNGEFSLLCHLKHQSIRVKVGDKVKQSDVLGLCGNTGNTTQPHIHFNLQDGPLMHKANGLPAQFSKIIVNKADKTNYEPIRGEFVSNK